MIEEKGKEMSALIVSLGRIEDSQIQRQKEISRIETRKEELVKECESADGEMKKLERKKNRLESFQQSYGDETKLKLQEPVDEIHSLQIALSSTDSKDLANDSRTMPVMVTGQSTEFLRFIDKQIEELENELECPVCLETAYQAPIYKCIYDHLMF